MAHLPALRLSSTETRGRRGRRRRRTRHGIDVRHQATIEDVIAYLREQRSPLPMTRPPGPCTRGTRDAATTITLKAS